MATPSPNNPNQGSGIMNDVSTLLKDMANNAFDLASGKYRAKSIAERARKSIMMYKVGVSSSIMDLEIAGDISKYLEVMYAVFTMINLGYNPYANSGDEIAKVIKSVSAEAYNPLDAFNAEANKSLEMAMKIYERKAKTSHSRIGRNAEISTEARFNYDKYAIRYGNDEHRKTEAEIKRIEAQTQRENDVHDEYMRKKQQELDREQKEKEEALQPYRTTAFISGLDKASVKAVPTIVTMKTKFAEIPLAIKANLYGIASNEVKNMIENALGGKVYNILRFIKWRSGEISTLAWLFNTDVSENNKKLYKSLGKNPWYIDLMKRKAAAKSTSFAKFVVNSGNTFNSKDEYKAVKADINNLKDLPPTASLIITKNDLVTATNLDITHFTKNEKLLKTIMKNLYLLCLGVVDPDTESINFFFDGYTYPFYVSFKDLKKSKDANQTLYEALKELARRS